MGPAERGILDSGRDFVEPVQYEAAAAAAGSAPTSEADFPDFRSPGALLHHVNR